MHGHDLGFENSDHNPVTVCVRFGRKRRSGQQSSQEVWGHPRSCRDIFLGSVIPFPASISHPLISSPSRVVWRSQLLIRPALP